MSSKIPIYKKSDGSKAQDKSISLKHDFKGISATSSRHSLDMDSMQPKKDVNKNSKFSNVQAKVVSRWSAEEMERNGIKNFFERKSGNSSASSSFSHCSTTSTPDSSFKSAKSTTSRRSLPVTITTDPIAVAIAQLKQNSYFPIHYTTSYTAFSSGSSTSSTNDFLTSTYADAEEN